jgi:hypothetical protein
MLPLEYNLFFQHVPDRIKHRRGIERHIFEVTPDLPRIEPKVPVSLPNLIDDIKVGMACDQCENGIGHAPDRWTVNMAPAKRTRNLRSFAGSGVHGHHPAGLLRCLGQKRYPQSRLFVFGGKKRVPDLRKRLDIHSPAVIVDLDAKEVARRIANDDDLNCLCISTDRILGNVEDMQGDVFHCLNTLPSCRLFLPTLF